LKKKQVKFFAANQTTKKPQLEKTRGTEVGERRSLRQHASTQQSILKKRTSSDAGIVDANSSVKKRPKTNRVQTTGGSLADKQFTHLTSESAW
jgi:hypothetical protein